MTPDEITLARAIAPGRVTYCPGIGTKRFARDMAYRAERSPEVTMTPRERKYLLDIAVKFRRQVPADVVALAQRMLAEDADA